MMPKFEPGGKVRVKRGVTDPDFPDIPLGGWAGIVKEVEQVKGEPTYLLEWDGKTLKGIHPIYRKRGERDGLEFETMWLGEEDIEPDEGKPVPIEKPTAIVTKPLSEKDQDDRTPMSPGLTPDDPLPDATRKTLLASPPQLKDRRPLPFPATTW